MAQIIQPSDSDPLSDGPAGWGPVPTLGGDVTTSIPDPITGTSTTSVQQTATATTQSIAQTVFLPPAPTWSALLDPSGNMTAAWITWFQVLNRKLGGYISTPADDAQILAYEPQQAWRDQTAEVLALFDAVDGASQQSPTVTDLWDEDRGYVYLSGDQRAYGAKTWMGKVGFFGTAATTKPAALTVVTANAPAGGVGTAAGGWDTAVNRDTAIALINNLKVRVGELESRLQSLGLLT